MRRVRPCAQPALAAGLAMRRARPCAQPPLRRAWHAGEFAMRPCGHAASSPCGGPGHAAGLAMRRAWPCGKPGHAASLAMRQAWPCGKFVMRPCSGLGHAASSAMLRSLYGKPGYAALRPCGKPGYAASPGHTKSLASTSVWPCHVLTEADPARGVGPSAGSARARGRPERGVGPGTPSRSAAYRVEVGVIGSRRHEACRTIGGRDGRVRNDWWAGVSKVADRAAEPLTWRVRMRLLISSVNVAGISAWRPRIGDRRSEALTCPARGASADGRLSTAPTCPGRFVRFARHGSHSGPAWNCRLAGSFGYRPSSHLAANSTSHRFGAGGLRRGLLRFSPAADRRG
jgi:hypothetical protein